MTQKARQDLLRPLIFAVEKARHLWFFASTMKPPPVDRTYSIDVNRFFWRAVRTGQSHLEQQMVTVPSSNEKSRLFRHLGCPDSGTTSFNTSLRKSMV